MFKLPELPEFKIVEGTVYVESGALARYFGWSHKDMVDSIEKLRAEGKDRCTKEVFREDREGGGYLVGRVGSVWVRTGRGVEIATQVQLNDAYERKQREVDGGAVQNALHTV